VVAEEGAPEAEAVALPTALPVAAAVVEGDADAPALPVEVTEGDAVRDASAEGLAEAE
jgi:hypothetical protein